MRTPPFRSVAFCSVLLRSVPSCSVPFVCLLIPYESFHERQHPIKLCSKKILADIAAKGQVRERVSHSLALRYAPFCSFRRYLTRRSQKPQRSQELCAGKNLTEISHLAKGQVRKRGFVWVRSVPVRSVPFRLMLHMYDSMSASIHKSSALGGYLADINKGLVRKQLFQSVPFRSVSYSVSRAVSTSHSTHKSFALG